MKLYLLYLLMLSIALTPQMGPLGAAIAVVASDLLIQFGLLALAVIRQTLQQPARHVAFLAAVMILVTSGGWALGTIIRSWVPGTGMVRFALECTLWLIVVAMVASPMARGSFRNRLIAAIPR